LCVLLIFGNTLRLMASSALPLCECPHMGTSITT
jgi:hypothetical protein